MGFLYPFRNVEKDSIVSSVPGVDASYLSLSGLIPGADTWSNTGTVMIR